MSGPLRQVLRWVAPYRGRMLLAAVLQTSTLSAVVGLMATSAWLLSAAALHPSIAALQISIVGVRFFGIARGVLRYLERLVAHDVTLRILSTLRVRIYDAIEPAGHARLAGKRSGDVLSGLVADVDTLEHVYVRVLGPSLAAGGVTLLTGLLLWRYSGWLSLTAVAGLASAGLLVPWTAWRLGSRAGARVVGLRANVAARVVDAVQGSADLAALGRADGHAEATAQASRDMCRAQQTAARAASLGGALTGLWADLTAVAVLAVALTLAPAEILDPVNLAVVTLLTLAAFEGVAALPAAYQSLGAVNAAATRVVGLQEGQADARPLDAAVHTPPARTLQIERLTFSYPGERRTALEDVSLRLEPGRPVALVGASGSGKSTLAHLVMRFWEPPASAIRLDGTDVTEMDPERVRRSIALVAQQTHLFAATLGENLRLARPDASDAELHEAARRAGLAPVIAQLPHGLGTWLGEQGLRLSGGERQRLAVARALLKGAPILVLDEPTSHLDPETARVVLDEIYQESRDRAVLVITHQLAGLDRMAEIVVVHEGAVRERGSFEALAAHGGAFSQMLRLEEDTLAE